MKKLFITICTSLFLSTAVFGQPPSQVPLETTFAVKPNVMILLDNSGSMGTVVASESKTRFEIAQDVITDLIEETTNVRFCLSIFRVSEGARMTDSMQCTSDRSELDTMVSTIDGLSPTTWTPLSETYYDITRYFRGEEAFFGEFGSDDVYPSPIQHRCQTNAAVVITDGEPTREWEAGPTPNDTGSNGQKLPNWDGIPANGTTDSRPFGEYSDGYCGTVPYGSCAQSSSTESATLFLDDLALFGKQQDLVTSGSAAGSTGDFLVQNLKTHTIGFEIDVQMLRDAAKYGDGEFVEATSTDELKEALERAIVTTLDRKGSGAGATQSEIALDADGKTNLYFTQYDTDDWSGDLLKVQLTENSVTHKLNAQKLWSAADKMDEMSNPLADRVIYTPGLTGTALLDFKQDALPDEILLKIKNNNLSKAKTIVDYVRGRTNLDQSKYRARDNGLLGDFVHSRATYVKNRNYGYRDADEEGTSYRDYILSNEYGESNARPPLLYVGGNDGMLHAFKEETGEELFAFVPTGVLGEYNAFRKPEFIENHRYLLDGETGIVDAKVLNSSGKLEWATVLGSPLGAGIKGLFLLDITDPTGDIRANLFKWEINHKTPLSATNTSKVFKRMGYMINPPKIVRFKIPEANNKFHDKWVLVAGNGIRSKYTKSGTKIIGAASVFIIDLDDGSLITELIVDEAFESDGSASYTQFSNGNGVTGVSAVDTDANTYIDLLYAADLKGNLWRIDYDAAQSIETSDAAYIQANLNFKHTTGGGDPIASFSSTGGVFDPQTGTIVSGSSGNTQAITTELTVTAAPADAGSREGVMVFFGTGQYYDFTHLLDEVNNKVQTMYAFWDKGVLDSGDPFTRDSLAEQKISTTGNLREIDETNSVTVNYQTGHLGWYMDLPERGERITRKAVGLFEHMAFFTQSPVSKLDPCVEGIDGWSMIAKKDVATPIEVTLASGSGSTTSHLGTKHTGDSIHDPIFIELSDGQFVAPVVIGVNGDEPEVEHTVQVQKDYSRGSWKRLEL